MHPQKITQQEKAIVKVALEQAADDARALGVSDNTLIEQATTQDPWWMSRRVYAAVAAVIATTLGAVGLQVDQVEITEIVAAAAALAAVVLPLISKRADIRPSKQRGKGAQ